MSHHGSEPLDGAPEDPERKRSRDKLMRDLMSSAADFKGALGDFPEGQLTKTDEGAIQFAVGEKDGKVVLDFGTPVNWVGMNPQQAADLASLLLKRARGRTPQDTETQAKLEIIYGLLWMVEVDKSTVSGMAASLARKTVLEMIDKDGQARGIEIAKRAVRGKMLQDISSQPHINPRAG